MTFILGLTAEPIPSQYVSQPKAERKAEVVGRQVLDKYNCAGCHQIRPGVYDFKFNEDNLKAVSQAYQLDGRRQRRQLQGGLRLPGA